MKTGLARLGDELARLTGGLPLRLRINSNRRTLLSCRRPQGKSGPVEASLHHAFLDAPPDALEAVALFLKREETPASRAALRRFIHQISAGPAPAAEPLLVAPNGAAAPASPQAPEALPAGKGALVAIRKALPPLPPEPPDLQGAGAHHDLRAIAQALNATHFGGECPVHVTWGREGHRPARARRRTILFGSYCSRRHLVTIHPALDSPDAPAFFVEFVVYHEMLHKAEPPVLSPTGRREVHTRAFRRRERLFPRYAEARAFEERFVREMARAGASFRLD
jgi:hypothetical protein